MHVIVHAGMEKTGSSALQEYLYCYRDELRDLDVIYPDLGHRSHWLFAAAIGGRRGKGHYFERRKERRNLADTEKVVLETVRLAIGTAKDNDVIILSHESFGKPLQSAGLASFLADCGVPNERLSVLAYVRNPVEHFPSSIQQRLKNQNKMITPPGDWKSDHVATAHNLFDNFGSRVELRAYGRDFLVEGDIVKDFSRFIRKQAGIDLPPPKDRIATNTSLSAEACALLQMAKTIPGRSLEGHDFVMLRGKLFKFDNRLRRAKLEVPHDWQALVAAANREQWNPLVDRLACGEDIKRRLKLPDVAPSEPVSRIGAELWIIDHYDPDYANGLAELWTAGLESRFSPALEVINWLADSPRWMPEFDRSAFANRTTLTGKAAVS